MQPASEAMPGMPGDWIRPFPIPSDIRFYLDFRPTANIMPVSAGRMTTTRPRPVVWSGE